MSKSRLDQSILKTLRESYLLGVQAAALFPESDQRHWSGHQQAANASATVLALFGGAAADALREEGLKECERIRARVRA